MKPKFIRVIAICVFCHDESILVSEGFDSVKNAPFYRPLGGGVEPGETSQRAAVREIQEELNLEAINLRLLGVLENRFTYEGEPGHEIVFVYDGEFVTIYSEEPKKFKMVLTKDSIYDILFTDPLLSSLPQGSETLSRSNALIRSQTYRDLPAPRRKSYRSQESLDRFL